MIATPLSDASGEVILGDTVCNGLDGRKTKLLNRVRRIRGQVDAVERALNWELGCTEVLQVIASARGAITGLMAEIIEDHIRVHFVPATRPDAETAHAAEELIEVIRAYLK